MKLITRSLLSMPEKLEIFELWNNEYPEKLAYESMEAFESYLKSLSGKSHILLIDSNKKIKGWYFDFTRDGGKWFVIILDSKLHGKGFGTRILELAKQKENELNGWVIDHNNDKRMNGEIYKSPLEFYLKNGFVKLPNKRLELDKISAVCIKWTKQG